MLRRGEYYYMVLAEGGTAGPPTSHMVVAARSRSIEGPWENSPYNPIIRTVHRDEKWWSKGHATLVEGPDGQWYLVYHGYENGFYNLGRQTLLEPVVWTDDGWFRSAGSDVAGPIPKPAGGQSVSHGMRLSDDFSTNTLGPQWSFYRGDDSDLTRCRFADGGMVMSARGQSPRDCSPLCCIAGDHVYEAGVEIELRGRVSGGLILFYSSKLYAGLGFDDNHLIMHRYGTERAGPRPQSGGSKLHLRLLNDRHVVSILHSNDGHHWTRFDRALEVSGYHHNVAGEFLSLRPALYAAGDGEVVFRNFRYCALP